MDRESPFGFFFGRKFIGTFAVSCLLVFWTEIAKYEASKFLAGAGLCVCCFLVSHSILKLKHGLIRYGLPFLVSGFLMVSIWWFVSWTRPQKTAIAHVSLGPTMGSSSSNNRPFMFLHRVPPSAELALTPVQTIAFVEFTSLSPTPIRINGYSILKMTEYAGLEVLPQLDPENGSLFATFRSLTNANHIEITNGLSRVIQARQFSQFESAGGWVFLNGIGPGETNLFFRFSDTENNYYSIAINKPLIEDGMISFSEATLRPQKTYDISNYPTQSTTN